VSNQLKASIVRILFNTGETPVGVGFLVSNRQVCTCAHVVLQALGLPGNSQEKPTETINLDFPLITRFQRFTARVVFWKPVQVVGSAAYDAAEDIALLELQEAPPPSAQPSRIIVAESLWGHTLRAFGFPAGYDQGVWASGVLRDALANGRVQIEGVNVPGHGVVQGFSGTPVWDEQLQGAVGMVVESDRQTGVKAAYIIPASVLKLNLRELSGTDQRGTTASAETIPVVSDAPFMSPDLPVNFVQRDREYWQIRRYLLNADHQYPVAITTALRGAGGFGKTTLAVALCQDKQVRRLFDDGVLWVTLGEKPDILGGLIKLYSALTDERPAFADVEEAATRLAEKLANRRCLVVIDDIWQITHLRPFLRSRGRSALLITTRFLDVAVEANAECVDVDEMTTDEAVQMLIAKLEPGNLTSFRKLARRLGEWPLILELTNAVLRKRIAQAYRLDKALEWVNKALDRYGVMAIKRDDADRRKQSAAGTIEVSLELLDNDQRSRYIELAVFPEDVSVPLTALVALWNIDEFAAEELVQHLEAFSLLKFDPQRGVVRLHDVVREYLTTQLKEVEILHARLIDNWGDKYILTDTYAWYWYTYHLQHAGRNDQLRDLLLDFRWLQAKLEATDVNALIADYNFSPHDEELQVVQGAIRLAAHALIQDKAQLAGQLLGRLLLQRKPGICMLLENTQKWRGVPWIRPLTPCLTSPGGPLLRTLVGHSERCYSLVLLPDGNRVVSASCDRTLKLWDLERGLELCTLKGHQREIWAVAMLPDGNRVISASADGTLKLWDLERGVELLTLNGHTRDVLAVSVLPDGRRAVSTSGETLQVWDLEQGKELLTLGGSDNGYLSAVAALPDGHRAVTGSYDHTVRVWDLDQGRELRALRGHTSHICKVAVLDEERVISVSTDGTLKVWDLKQEETPLQLDFHPGVFKEELRTVTVLPDKRGVLVATGHGAPMLLDLETGKVLLRGDDDLEVSAMRVLPDRKRVVSTSYDGTIKVWCIDQMEMFRSPQGHYTSITSVAILPDGKRAVSASGDRTLKLWNLENRKEIATLRGHTEWINTLALVQDEERAITASFDRTLKIWDLKRRVVIKTLKGHKYQPLSVAVSANGEKAISIDEGSILKVWELSQGKALHTWRKFDSVDAVAIYPDGSRMILGWFDGTLEVWKLTPRLKLLTLEGHTEEISSIEITSDGLSAISSSHDQTIKIWDLKSGELLRTLEGHSSWISTVSLAGKQLISSSADCTLRVWDLETGRTIATFSADRPIYACATTPDGVNIVAGDGSGQIYFLQLERV